MKKRVTLILILIAVSLSGCKQSPTLTEIVYRQEAPEIDLEQEMVDPADEGDESEDFTGEEIEDANTPRDTDAEIGLEETPEETPPAEDAVEVEYNPNANNDWQSQNTPEQSAQENGGEASPTPPPTATPSPTATRTPPPTPTSYVPTLPPWTPIPEMTLPPTPTWMPTLTPTPTPEPTPTPPPSEEPTQPDNGEGEPLPPSMRQVVDGSGQAVEVPENVETVTATGAAAQFVELLGGSGRLVGADSMFLSSSLAASAFRDLDRVSNWWNGDGSAGLSESAFAALLDARPDVCFEWSGNTTFSGEQVQRLTDAGISYVVLPALSSRENFQTAVTLIGQVLGVAENGTDAPAAAATYNAWVDSVFSEVGQRCAGIELSSLYIAGWDDSATYALNYADSLPSNGSGLAYAYSPRKPQMVSAFMSAANVTNESTRIRALHRDGYYVYVTPMFHQFDPAVSGTRAVFYSGAGEYGAAYDLFVARQVTSTLYYQLGHPNYPTLIVADANTQAQIENNIFWQYRESDANGFVNIDGENYYRGVGGNYQIYVNPTGMGSWAEGSIDAPLESYWIAAKVAETMTMEEVKSRTADFYSRFLGVSLNEGQLTQIFGE